MSPAKCARPEPPGKPTAKPGKHAGRLNLAWGHNEDPLKRRTRRRPLALSVDKNPSPIPESLEHTQEADCVRHFSSRRRWLRLGLWGTMGTLASLDYRRWSPPVVPLYFNGLYAYAHVTHPPIIHRVVAIANQLVDKPYKWGGGHRVLYDNGFDCSGSISHVLYRSSLLDRPLTSAAFASYALPGHGSYLTLYVKPGQHVFMEVCGLRFDTSGSRAGEGPRWRVPSRSREGFLPRHPPWL